MEREEAYQGGTFGDLFLLALTMGGREGVQPFPPRPCWGHIFISSRWLKFREAKFREAHLFPAACWGETRDRRSKERAYSGRAENASCS